MPYDDPDITDPMTLTGVAFETDDLETHREMARCFIEEYMRIGFSQARIRHMFQVSGYAGPHLALTQLGQAEIDTLLAEQVDLWGPRHVVRSEQIAVKQRDGNVRLSVIDC